MGLSWALAQTQGAGKGLRNPLMLPYDTHLGLPWSWWSPTRIKVPGRLPSWLRRGTWPLASPALAISWLCDLGKTSLSIWFLIWRLSTQGLMK